MKQSVVKEKSDVAENVLSVTVADAKLGHQWVLDSGCSYYMFPNSDWFTSYQSGTT